MHYPKKPQAQNLHWSLKVLLTTYQARQRLQLKSSVCKVCSKSPNEIDFTESHIQITQILHAPDKLVTSSDPINAKSPNFHFFAIASDFRHSTI